MSDDEIWNLKRGGHDYRKVYAAYQAATEHNGQPTVILAKTIKGSASGPHFEGRNATHQMKKLTLDDLKEFRDRLLSSIPDAAAGGRPVPAAVLPPGRESTEIQYMLERRAALGGSVPPAPGDGQAADAARPTRSTTAMRPRLGQAGGRHHDGVRPAAQGPDEGQGDRAAVRADHPGRGPHVRHGLVLPDRQDLQPARAALHLGRPRAAAGLQGVEQRADPARGHQRGRLDGARSPRPAPRTPRTASR